MITPDYCRLMARYNAWQNGSLTTAACSLDAEARSADRGAFFGSIIRTFNHLYWDDALWLARFSGDERPEDHVPVSLDDPSDWQSFLDLRRARDAEVAAWAKALSPSDFEGALHFYPGGGDTRISKSRALCAVHLFNHQTHHRGQIHAMLTAAGAEPEPTDLPMLN